MTDRETHLTDEQMNELVFADVNDPSAWGDPISVRASKGPRRIRHAKHLELASKFYVLSVLHRLGADATLTFSQSDNVDITVVLESGHALTVDVKTISGPLEWQVADFRARSGHFLTFVRYAVDADPNTPPDVYIVASEQLQAFLANRRDNKISLDELDGEVHAREAWERLAVANAA
ncbi:MAG: hypothetical protein QOE82_430 [Thermoanaerobaculia bacterium]|jgi:hypothetical protein|nr:hypothetical protein [Thermoanaerobaculia bacterium]